MEDKENDGSDAWERREQNHIVRMCNLDNKEIIRDQARIMGEKSYGRDKDRGRRVE